MGSMIQQLPKPMIPLAGKPILEYQIELAKRFGYKDIIILTGYLAHQIEDYFKDGADWQVNIRYQRESSPLGTAGAIKNIADWLKDDFLVFYGDIVMDVDLTALTAFHTKNKPLGSLLVHPNNHPYDSDLLEIDQQNRITAFYAKPHDHNRYYRNLVNAALYVLSPEILRYIPEGRFADLGRDIFPKVVQSGELLLGYNTPEYITDVGTLDRLKKVTADVVSGKVARLNRQNARRAVFLDRDGVLNAEVGLVRSAEQLHLLPDAAEAVRLINESEYLTVVVSNQPVIAKGFTSFEELHRIHAKLETLLGDERAYLDSIYYCPHHPEKGFPGERPQYKIPCPCRKPAPGMILAAAAELNINLSESFVIGDRTADIQAGANAGTRTILVRTGCAGKDAKYPCRPDFEFENLTEAVDFIIDRHDQPCQGK